MEKKKEIWDWNINCKSPFIHFYKREQYLVEEIEDNFWEAAGLMFAALPIIIAVRIYLFFKKIL